MNVLLVSPLTPSTFWSFKSALKFVSKKSSEPPLGLLTIAAMLPEKWEKKLIDMNVAHLTDEHLRWADYLFITGMNIHLSSFKTVVQRCNERGVKVVAGGPMCTTDYHQIEGVDHFILNEAEVTLPRFLEDLENGNPQHLYKTEEFPGLSDTPAPLWNLLDMKKYASMSVQYSRGCPYDCEFCSITLLNGRIPRTKSADQFILELESLFQAGWRGGVFVVDDNFIGNKNKLKKELLPALISWSKERNFPFNFTTEVSINLADDDELVQMMVEAGFDHTFIGIETPNTESLTECGKTQNKKRDMVTAVKKLQNQGLIVSGGFIVGFDNDPPGIFQQQINFIQNSGIVTAMVGLLNAPSGTRLFQRMKKENRLLKIMSGDNMDGSTNFIPRMNYDQLIDGYRRIIKTIYSQNEYYQRLKTFLNDIHLPGKGIPSISFNELMALLKSFWFLGVLEKGKRYFWRLLLFTAFRHPRKLPLAVRMAIYGFHFRRVAETI